MTYPTPLKAKLECTYANDTLVYSTINTIDDCIQLQRGLLELKMVQNTSVGI